jgi:hypothetical protein
MTCRFHKDGHSDDAKRMADAINLHYHAQGWDAVGKFVAILLKDGSSDGNLYDTFNDAARHNARWPRTIIRLRREHMPVCEAQTILNFYRRAADRGFSQLDPDERRQVIMPHRNEAIADQLARLRAALN